jgi:hypothetical protein
MPLRDRLQAEPLDGAPAGPAGNLLDSSIPVAEKIAGRDPERIWVRQVRVGRHHPVDEFGRRGTARQRRLEVSDVPAALVDLAARVVIGGRADSRLSMRR